MTGARGAVKSRTLHRQLGGIGEPVLQADGQLLKPADQAMEPEPLATAPDLMTFLMLQLEDEEVALRGNAGVHAALAAVIYAGELTCTCGVGPPPKARDRMRWGRWLANPALGLNGPATARLHGRVAAS